MKKKSSIMKTLLISAILLSRMAFGLTVEEYKGEMTRIGNEMNQAQTEVGMNNMEELIPRVKPLLDEIKNLDPPESLAENHRKLSEGVDAWKESMEITMEMLRMSKEPKWTTNQENFKKLQDFQQRTMELQPKLQSMQDAMLVIQSAN